MTATALLLLLAASATACGEGESSEPDASTTTASAKATTTTEADATTTTEPEATAAGTCDEGDAGDPPTAEEPGVSVAIVDADGDDLDDDVTVYPSGDPEPWLLHIEWGAGGQSAAVVTPASPDAGVEVLGGHDVDGDGDQEIFVRVGQGASASLVGLYEILGCTPERVRNGGSPAVFPVGASVGNQSGLACFSDLLVSYEGQTPDAETYEWAALHHALSGADLSVVDSETGTYTRPQDDGEIAALSNLDCPGVFL